MEILKFERSRLDSNANIRNNVNQKLRLSQHCEPQPIANMSRTVRVNFQMATELCL